MAIWTLDYPNILCRDCKGAGWLPPLWKKRCAVCHGSGRVPWRLEVPDRA